MRWLKSNALDACDLSSLSLPMLKLALHLAFACHKFLPYVSFMTREFSLLTNQCSGILCIRLQCHSTDARKGSQHSTSIINVASQCIFSCRFILPIGLWTSGRHVGRLSRLYWRFGLAFHLDFDCRFCKEPINDVSLPSSTRSRTGCLPSVWIDASREHIPTRSTQEPYIFHIWRVCTRRLLLWDLLLWTHGRILEMGLVFLVWFYISLHHSCRGILCHTIRHVRATGTGHQDGLVRLSAHHQWLNSTGFCYYRQRPCPSRLANTIYIHSLHCRRHFTLHSNIYGRMGSRAAPTSVRPFQDDACSNCGTIHAIWYTWDLPSVFNLLVSLPLPLKRLPPTTPPLGTPLPPPPPPRLPSLAPLPTPALPRIPY